MDTPFRPKFALATLLAISSLAYITWLYLGAWQLGFNSDTALIGLMAKAIAFAGERPLFVWSVGYQGMLLEGYLGALFLRLFGPLPMVYDFAPTFYLWLGLGLWSYAAARVFGKMVALLSFTATIFSMPLFYQLNLRPQPNFPEALLLASLFILAMNRCLSEWESGTKLKRSSLLTLGAVAGFSLYTFALTVYFLLAGALCAAAIMFREDLRQGWRVGLETLLVPWREGRRVWVYARSIMGWSAVTVASLTFVWTPAPFALGTRTLRWEPLKILAIGIALLATPALLRAVRLAWRRHTPSPRAMGVMGVGFLVGYGPALYHKLILGGHSVKQPELSGNLDAVLFRLDVMKLFHAELLHMAWLWAWPGALLALGATVYSGLSISADVRRFIRGQSSHWPRAAVYAAVPLVVTAIFLTTGFVSDLSAMRYLILLVPVYSCLLAHGCVVAWQRWPRLRWAVASASLSWCAAGWLAIKADLALPPVMPYAAIANALDDQHLRFAYADYWLAYATDLLSNERVILEPLYSNYAPQYAPQISAAERIGYVDYVPPRIPTVDGRVNIRGTSYRVHGEQAITDRIHLQVLEKVAATRS